MQQSGWAAVCLPSAASRSISVLCQVMAFFPESLISHFLFKLSLTSSNSAISLCVLSLFFLSQLVWLSPHVLSHLKTRWEINTMTALSKTMPQFTYSYGPRYAQWLYPAGPTCKCVPPSDLSLDISYRVWDSVMDGQSLDGWTPDELLEGKTAQCIALGFWGFLSSTAKRILWTSTKSPHSAFCLLTPL